MSLDPSILNNLIRKYKVFPKSSDLWGVEKDNAFHSSRIIVNFHAEVSSVFESPRFYEAASYRRMIVSEPIFDSFPFKSPKHYIDVHLSGFERALDQYLSNDCERLRIETSAIELASEYSIERSAKLMADAIILRHYLLSN